VDKEDFLILQAERLGLGLDLNYLRDRYTVEMPDRRKNKTFRSIDDALDFVNNIARQKLVVQLDREYGVDHERELAEQAS